MLKTGRTPEAVPPVRFLLHFRHLYYSIDQLLNGTLCRQQLHIYKFLGCPTIGTRVFVLRCYRAQGFLWHLSSLCRQTSSTAMSPMVPLLANGSFFWPWELCRQQYSNAQKDRHLNGLGDCHQHWLKRLLQAHDGPELADTSWNPWFQVLFWGQKSMGRSM